MSTLLNDINITETMKLDIMEKCFNNWFEKQDCDKFIEKVKNQDVNVEKVVNENIEKEAIKDVNVENDSIKDVQEDVEEKVQEKDEWESIIINT